MWAWLFSVCCVLACQTLPIWSELTNNTAKTKMAYISLLSDLNAIIGIKSYYCVILKMVILHHTIKAFQNSVFVFFPKKEQKPVSFKKKKNPYKKNKTCELFFLNPAFLSFNPFL